MHPGGKKFHNEEKIEYCFDLKYFPIFKQLKPLQRKKDEEKKL